MLLDTHGITCDRCLAVNSGDFTFYACSHESRTTDIHLCVDCFSYIANLLDKHANKKDRCELTGRQAKLSNINVAKIDVKFSASMIKCLACGSKIEDDNPCRCGGELAKEAFLDISENYMTINASNEGLKLLTSRQ